MANNKSITSTKISNSNNIRAKLNADQWTLNVIGNFMLNLYHRTIISKNDDWCIEKSDMRKMFSKYVTSQIREKLKKLENLTNKNDIGGLLHRCGFLINTEKGSTFYRVRCRALYDFRNEKLKELDNIRMYGIQTNSDEQSETSSVSPLLTEPSVISVEDKIEVDILEPKNPLTYQGTMSERRVENYFPTNISCCICQTDCSSMDSFETHIQIHNEETDFEFLKFMTKQETPIFTMTYRLCTNSHYFCFELETSLENIIIEKLIIVQSRSFVYVNTKRLPQQDNGYATFRFFCDSHLFTRYIEKPIIVICHLENDKNIIIIEQHHFMRSEEFPIVHFSFSPCLLPTKLFKTNLSLDDYFPSTEVQNAMKDNSSYRKFEMESNNLQCYLENEKQLTPKTMVKSLKILLEIEDIEIIQEYVSLTQEKIKLRSYGDEYSFQLNSKDRVFSENVLAPNDEVILTTRTDMLRNTKEILSLILRDTKHRKQNNLIGLIQDINSKRITFKCYKKVDIHGSYTVIFRPSRMNFRYRYRSLDLLSRNMTSLSRFLFPFYVIPKNMPTISLNLYNENLNPEQLEAVANIAQGPRNDATYIINGPPGTGKTTTLVESILQVLKRPETKVLVNAGSNSACDEVASRLCKYLKQSGIKRGLVRIYARSCEVRSETIDDELLAHSNMYNGQFYPDIEILHEYRVVVCTLSVVAKLSTGGFGHNLNGTGIYTHLFIDEVAASMETDALMAITSILTEKSCLIISGDNKQLGPILKSTRAKELGLDLSLMDRLLKYPCYCYHEDGDYDRSIQTRLIRNHRSHPEIVNLYNVLYYNSKLKALANIEDVSLCKIWHKSLNKEYPIIFHAAYEPSKHSNQSQSLYNMKELYIVMDYVKDLMYYGINGEPVKESDIGIISPYKRQYKRIQEELNLRKWFQIETGSVEMFQGREKNIIIVSFVRSYTKSLGFLESSRRLNVTLSRSKALLILIGNPNTLSQNSDFEFIINACKNNKTFIGNNAETLQNPIKLNKNMQDSVSIEHMDQQTDDKEHKRSRRRGRRGSRGSGSNRRSDSRSNSKHGSIEQNISGPKDNENEDIGKLANHTKDYCSTDTKENRIETIFSELPDIPKSCSQTKVTYTKNSMLQLAKQQQNYSSELAQKLSRLQLKKNQPLKLNDTLKLTSGRIPNDSNSLNTIEKLRIEVQNYNKNYSPPAVSAAKPTSAYTTATVTSHRNITSSSYFKYETIQPTRNMYQVENVVPKISTVSYGRPYGTPYSNVENGLGYDRNNPTYTQRKKEKSNCVIL